MWGAGAVDDLYKGVNAGQEEEECGSEEEKRYVELH